MNSDAGLTAVLADMRPALLRYLVARGATHPEAEDVLQDVYLTLADVASGPVAEPRAYLYRAATNRWLDHRRGATRQGRREQDWMAARAGALPAQDDQPTPEAQLIGAQSLRLVERALAALPERTVAIFRRFRIDGEPQRAIAGELGISVSAVEKHLQRAYQAVLEIRQRLDAEPDAARRLMPESDANED